jgi:uncharacterized repeat protein (TIGR03803 family)
MFRIRKTAMVSACVLLAGILIPLRDANATRFHVVYTFQSTKDGYEPHAGVIKDGAGNLYGTTFYGGDTQLGQGTVFRLAPDGTKTVLHAFTGGTDGGLPAGLILDASGNLYGTTLQGGLIGGCNSHGCGVVYKIDTNGNETVLYTFGGYEDGAFPQGVLMADKRGNLYGTTTGGGDDRNGTVFKLTTDGKEKVLHSFAGGTSDGQSPASGLISDGSGNMYGTTNLGGGTGCDVFGPFGCGIVYKIARDGTESILYAFTGGSDGGNPVGALLMDKSGNLYGTTEFGGLSGGCDSGSGGQGCGTVFRLTPAGAFSVLYTFTGGSDGGQPVADLVSDTTGNLYGTTLFWGSGYGVVFRLTPNGKETVLHSFTDGDDGAYPWGALLKRGHSYYSTSSGGGAQDFGTIFKLRP